MKKVHQKETFLLETKTLEMKIDLNIIHKMKFKKIIKNRGNMSNNNLTVAYLN